MAGPLCAEYSDARRHVICRGSFQFPVFPDDQDKSLAERGLSRRSGIADLGRQ